eukprot:13306459-Ditylum_brightwellii.AAC.1
MKSTDSVLVASSIHRKQKQYTFPIKEKKKETAPQTHNEVEQEHIKHIEHIKCIKHIETTEIIQIPH